MAVRKSRRQRGTVDELPSGSLRVRVYAGCDAVTGRRHYLDEVVPAGPGAAKEAERIRVRMVNEIDERRNPKTNRTVNQLLDRYLEVLDVEGSTRRTYGLYIENHIRPVLGKHQIGRLDAEDFDSFYAELRRCRLGCRGRSKVKHIKHRTQREHECTADCVVVPCKGLSASTVRQIHWILSGAMGRAQRWRWISTNPLAGAEPPSPPAPKPSPPSAADAARILNESWKDPDWGAFVWTAMTTGARRGELCALQVHDVDLVAKVLTIRAGLKLGDDGLLSRQDTKTHQQRRVALDEETVAVMQEQIDRLKARSANLKIPLSEQAYLFSLVPDALAPMIPDTATQRYDRMARRLKIATTLHKLRHFSATELISAGVDIRTVAGRLGHGGGGTTTLKVYAAWVSEADQRAAAALGTRLQRPTGR